MHRPMLAQGEHSDSLVPTNSVNSSHPRHYRATTRGEAGVEEESPIGFNQYWRILLRHKIVLLAVSMLGALSGVLITTSQSPVYQARVSLEVENLNQNFLNLRDLIPTAPDPGLDYDVQTQARLLQSRALMERVVARHPDLAKKLVKSVQTGRRPFWDRILGRIQHRSSTDGQFAITQASDRLKVRAVPNTRIIEVTFDAADRQLAADFANGVGSEFIELALEQHWKTNQHIAQWLTSQMRDLKVKLNQSEEQLRDYARTKGLVYTAEQNLSEQRLRELQDELSKAQADRVAKQSKFESATTAPVETLPDVLDDPALRDYQVQLTTLRRQLAELAPTYQPAHPKMIKLQGEISAVETALNRRRLDIAARARNEYQAAQRREKLLTADYAAQAHLVQNQADEVAHYNIMKREADSMRQLYESTFQRVNEAGLTSALRASNIHIVDPALPPERPYKPQMVLNVGFGLCSGMCLALMLALVRERADRRIQQPGESSLYLGAPELGIVPTEGRACRGLLGRPQEVMDSKALAKVKDRLSNKEEAFRAVVTSILFSEFSGGRPGVLVISSATAGEGKTTVSSNLAVALAQANLRVLLIDGDLRRPQLHQIFGVSNNVGLSSVLSGKAVLTLRETKVPKLYLLPSGPGQDANILFAPMLGELLRRLRNEFDIILIDSPPLLPVPDARVLARHADGVVMIIRAHHTTRDLALLAYERLQMDGTTVLGSVLNDWHPDKTPGVYDYRA